jgi:starch synthase
MSSDRLRILLVASEVSPFASTGGLAEAVGGLARALQALGHDVRLFMPKYRDVERAAGTLAPTLPYVPVPIRDGVVEAAVLEGRLGASIPVYFLAQDRYYDRPTLYTTPERDYWDNCERFTFFSRGVLTALAALEWTPDVIHAHDWQAGLVPVYVKTLYRDAPFCRAAATVFTVHNLAYQGLFWHHDFPITGLGWELFTPAGIEFYGMLSFLKAGLVFADRLTTVGPTYAREVLTPEHGERLDGVLRARREDLEGILHGIDHEVWNPATDPELPQRFGPGDLEGKAACRRALRSALGLAEPDRPGPVVAMITRLSAARGVDLALAAVPRIVEDGGQFVLLGHGEARYEAELRSLAAARPGAVAARLEPDDARLTRLIYAGSDLFLAPSRHEPDGFAQLIALRYGSIPVARRTGGLADSVRDWDADRRDGTGFLFDADTSGACRGALSRAFEAFASAPTWARLTTNAMREDFSWTASARQYVACYRRALARLRKP